MNTYKIYISSLWKQIQKLFKSGGEGFLLVGKVLVVVVLVMGYGESRGQELKEESEIMPLRVGDYLPKDFWNQKVKVYNQGDTSVIELSKYKGKSLLIDFWATWCVSCINGFPKLVGIQNKFKNNLGILLVNSQITRDDYSKIHFMKDETLRKNSLLSVYDDKYITALTPHTAIPYYIWINPKGRITAISFSEMLNEEQVEKFINYNKIYESNN